jgi:endonuclease/exonuclease/phosphatase family metal-dependent hydrolase
MHRRFFLGACLAVIAGQASARAETRRIAVLSYNIHHGEGTDGKIDLPRIAGVINGVKPDLVALQEVDRGTTRSGGVDQLAELARLTGLKPYFGKTIDHQGGEYGNAVLVREDTTEHCNTPLPGREPRGLLSIRTAGGVLFLGTHLDVGRDHQLRLQSAERINEWIAARGSTPAILTGDLNAVRGTPAIDTLVTRWTIAGEEIPTIPSADPRRQIDFILYRPENRWHVVEVRVLDEPVASDHRPIFAVLELR